MEKRKYGYNWAAPDRYKLLRQYQKENRAHLTDAERLFADAVRHSGLDIRMRSQYIIGDYIVDYVVLASMLVVEIDGGYHAEAEQVYEDIIRENALKKYGFKILRFTNEEVMTNLEAVINLFKSNL